MPTLSVTIVFCATLALQIDQAYAARVVTQSFDLMQSSADLANSSLKFANNVDTNKHTTCGGSDFEVVRGDTLAGARKIMTGIHQWVMAAADGSWGDYMKREWASFTVCAKKLISAECVKEKVCAQTRLLKVNMCGVRGKAMLKISSESQLPQNEEASKLLKIIVMGNFIQALAGFVDVPADPKLIAAFTSDGLMQSLGEIAFDEAAGKLKLPSAVTLYALTYAVKSTAQASKGAGRALIGGWFEQSTYNEHLTLTTSPASAFVRKYYMDNGGHTSCAARGKFNATTCEEMLQEKKNCNCEVELCITPVCHWYFAAAVCNRLGVKDMITGKFRGCYTMFGKFNGVCAKH